MRIMQKLLVLTAFSATLFSALRRKSTEREDFASEQLKKADTDSDGQASYSNLMSSSERNFHNADANSDGLMSQSELTSVVAASRDELTDPEQDHKEEDALNEVVTKDESKIHPDLDPKQILHKVAESLGKNDEELENDLHETATSFLEKDFRNADNDSDSLLSQSELTSVVAASRDELTDPKPDDKEEEALNEVVAKDESEMQDEGENYLLHKAAESLGYDDKELESLQKNFRNADSDSDSLLSQSELTSVVAASRDELTDPEQDHKEEDALNEVVMEDESKLHPDLDPKQILHKVAESLGKNDEELENDLQETTEEIALQD
eukprot:TRINITY_DN3071_c0_g1_i1.p1 TRINITY_DN3071_c0_g1~~TRINITY_DN3071_c0_g1_i1.p1  ORF type:complete len:323 (+),score=93.09 TRINITY_DN3071_c0_g1_i1:89-1057(+)